MTNLVGNIRFSARTIGYGEIVNRLDVINR
jgi:hypothetical protein